MERATGLNTQGVASVLRVIKRINKNPFVARQIQQYEDSVAKGGRVDDISALIRLVDNFVEQNPEYQARRVAQPDRGQQVTVNAALDARTAQGKAGRSGRNC